MNLKEAVERYLEAAGGFGEAMPLGGFGLPQAEAEAMLSAWDEDYHLHRHFELILASGKNSTSATNSTPFNVNGVLYSKIIIRETIREVLP